jgi:hypothetical protein
MKTMPDKVWCAILRKRRPSAWSFALGLKTTNCIFVSQVNQGAGKDDDGATTETVGTATADNPLAIES